MKQAETGTRVAEVCRKMGISEATFYNWKKKYGGLGVSELQRLKQLEEENRQLKKLVADLKQGDPLILAAYTGNSDLARLMIQKYGVDVNKSIKTKDKYTNNSTALHFAAIKGHEKTVKVLLAEGAEINAQNKNGDTALILAAMNGHLQTITGLIGYGADITIKNNDGYTALSIALKEGKIGSIKILEKAGAKE